MSNNEYDNTDFDTLKKGASVESNDYFSPGVRNNPESAATNNAGIVQSIGHLLSKARLARGMSVEEVSQQLRLSVHQIEAIEREDFEKLPGQTFIRGFVRNYANLVGLDSSTILPLLPQSAATVRVQRTPLQFNEVALSSMGRSGGNKVIFTLIVLALLALILFGLYQSSGWWKRLIGGDGKDSIVGIEQQTDQETVELQLPISSAPSTGALFTPNLQSASPLPIENVYGTLHFLFTTDAWVAVKDGSGKTIFEQTNSGGSERVVSGQRPLSLVIRNAAGVSLTYNDRSIDIKPYTRSEDGMASFTLE